MTTPPTASTAPIQLYPGARVELRNGEVHTIEPQDDDIYVWRSREQPTRLSWMAGGSVYREDQEHSQDIIKILPPPNESEPTMTTKVYEPHYNSARYLPAGYFLVGTGVREPIAARSWYRGEWGAEGTAIYAPKDSPEVRERLQLVNTDELAAMCEGERRKQWPVWEFSREYANGSTHAVETGEVRRPKKGEWVKGSDNRAEYATYDWNCYSGPILTLVPPILPAVPPSEPVAEVPWEPKAGEWVTFKGEKRWLCEVCISPPGEPEKKKLYCLWVSAVSALLAARDELTPWVEPPAPPAPVASEVETNVVALPDVLTICGTVYRKVE